MKYRTSVNHKGIAREKLLGKYTVIIGAILIMQLIFFVTGSITGAVVDTSTVYGMVIYAAINVIVELISAVFTVGEYTMYMKLSCNDDIRIGDIFEGFKGHPDKAIILRFRLILRYLLCMLPAVIMTVVYLYRTGGSILSMTGGFDMEQVMGHDRYPVLVTLYAVFIIAGLAGAIYVFLGTSQCFYILIDYPELSVSDVLKKSYDMMRGHMWEYLYIRLSFIPLCLLGILSAGIGFMYIRPYRGMTCTEYYLGRISGAGSKGNNMDIIVDDSI